MNLIQILSLAILQGISEILPISSSGHLVLLQNILQIEGNLISLFIYLHFASLLAIIFFFWPQIKKIKKKEIQYIIVATVPIVIFGLLAGDFISEFFSSNRLVSLALLTTALINFSTHLLIKKDKKETLNIPKTIRIGLTQALAIIPGISRSGTTLNAALREKVDKDESLNFIFLLSIPAISGALTLDLIRNGLNQELGALNLGLAIFTTFFVTLFSLKFLKKIIKKGNFIFFAIYCLIAAIISFFFI